MIESLVPAATTVTTRESIAGTVRMFRAVVAYLLPVTSSLGVGNLVGFGLGVLLGLLFGLELFFFDGVGIGAIDGRARSRLRSMSRSWVNPDPLVAPGESEVLAAGGAG